MNVRLTVILPDNRIHDYFANLTDEQIDGILSRYYFSGRGAQRFKSKLLRIVHTRCEYVVGVYRCIHRAGHDVGKIPHSLDEL